MKHIKRCLSASEDVMIFRQGQGLTAKLLAPRAAWQGPNGEPTQQQERILQKLLTGEPNYYSLTASRGRGKSALAGMLIQRWQGRGKCLLTGPNNASVESVVRWSQGKALFVAPDLLLAQCQRKERDCVDWLIVDEAAAIPISLLYQLTNYFTRILFTTTVLGYEGTGRGFLLKFCPGLPKWEKLTLSTPIRFAENDPLETFIDRLLLLNDDDVDDVANVTVRQCHIISLSQQTLSDEPALLSRFYGLLTSAHYRTTPLDLRRLLDAPNALYFAALNEENHIISALWAVQEGGLSEPLAHEVWAGRRRPKGNLVAQSLSAHAGLYSAPVLSSIRISRIAVEAGYRRRGIARRAIAYLAALAADRGVDYLSVSFGYTKSLAHFWRSCGLRIIHMGSQKEASSGCYAAMAILPFTDRGRALLDEGLTHFNRSQPQNDVVEARCLNESDWRELAGFAFGLRSLESAYASLGILVEIDINNYSIILNSYIKREKTMAELIIEFNLSGKKAFINRCRDEVARLLFQTDNQKTAQLRQWVLN